MNQVFHQMLRQREEYVQAKADAKLTLTDMIKKRHADLANSGFLDRSFDFYGMSFRLQSHEKNKIAKNLVITQLAEENSNLRA